MGAYISIASLVIMMSVLALVLSVVGVQVHRLLARHFATKRANAVKPVSLAAAAKSRAAARQAARA
jgi:hypothetical protein